MSCEEIARKLNNVIYRNCDYEGDLKGKSFTDDLELDSVSLMQLVVEVEEEFKVSLDESDNLLELMDNYDNLLEYLQEKLEG